MAANSGVGSSGGGKGQGIRAGRAYVEFFGKDGGLSKMMTSLQGRTLKLGLALAGLGSIKGIADTLQLGAVGKLAQAVLERGTEIQHVADQLGSSAEVISRLGYAADVAGVGLDGLRDSAKDLLKNISDAASGGGPVQAFQALGLAAGDLIDLPLDRQFGAIADALSAVDAPADRARLAMAVLGESGLKMLPLLTKGSAGLKSLATEAEEVGAAMSSAEAKQAIEVSQGLARAWNAAKFALHEIGKAVLPSAEQMADMSAQMVKAAKAVRDWIKDNRGLVIGVVAVTAAMAAAAVGVVALGATLIGVSYAVGVAVSAISAITGVIMAMTNPITLVGVAIGAVSAAIVALGAHMVASSDEFKSSWSSAKDTAITAIGGIKNALASGDLSLGMEIAASGIKAIWKELLLFLTKGWVSFKNFIVDGWQNVITALSLGLVEIVDVMPAWAQRQMGFDNFDKEAMRKQIIGDHWAERDQRDAFRRKQIDDAAKEVDDEKAKLRELAGKAGQRKAAEAGRMEQELPRSLRLPVAAATRGLFSAPDYRMALGIGGSVAMRTAKATEETAKNTGKIAEKIDGLQMEFA